jgi:hypothetical protein
MAHKVSHVYSFNDATLGFLKMSFSVFLSRNLRTSVKCKKMNEIIAEEKQKLGQ